MASALISGLLLYASPAQAAHAAYDEPGIPTAVADGCTITDIAPERVVVGIAAKRVQFAVETDCDATEDMRWAVVGDLYPYSPHVSWFGACNYTYTGPSVIDCTDEGAGYIDPIGETTAKGYGNDLAGENTIYAYAFVDANHNGYDDDETLCSVEDAEDCADEPKDRDDEQSTFELLRRSTFSAFNAGPEPRRKGQALNMDATLNLADWDSGTYAGASRENVKVQFKAAGESTFRSVATVRTDRSGYASFTTKAKRSGYWRLHFPGNDQLAAASSKTDYVKVNPAR